MRHPLNTHVPRLVLALSLALLSACGGGGGGGDPAPATAAPASSAPGSTAGVPAGTSAASALAARLGKPNRFLVGLGTGSSPASIQAQGLKPDIYDVYLVGVGAGAWPEWNSPSGDYVNRHAERADQMGAVPMFTLYQMASNGDGNLAGLADAQFMARYWANVRLMFQRIAMFGKPVLVTVEPDFWGYVQRQSPGGDPRRTAAQVSVDADCAGQPNDVTGVAGCIFQMARKYAPKAAVGLMPSAWGANTAGEVATFMQAVGAQRGDFVAMETLDRDAGCFEARGAECTRAGSGWYWDETAFRSHLALGRTLHQALGLPLIWWQTPLGVPSDSAGGAPGRYRDNRVQLFLTRTAELAAVGGLGAVFSTGAAGQTTVDSDGGQFQRLSRSYLASPVPLP